MNKKLGLTIVFLIFSAKSFAQDKQQACLEKLYKPEPTKLIKKCFAHSSVDIPACPPRRMIKLPQPSTESFLVSLERKFKKGSQDSLKAKFLFIDGDKVPWICTKNAGFTDGNLKTQTFDFQLNLKSGKKRVKIPVFNDVNKGIYPTTNGTRDNVSYNDCGFSCLFVTGMNCKKTGASEAKKKFVQNIIFDRVKAYDLADRKGSTMLPESCIGLANLKKIRNTIKQRSNYHPKYPYSPTETGEEVDGNAVH